MAKYLVEQHALAIAKTSNVPGAINPAYFSKLDKTESNKLRGRLKDEKITVISPRNLELLRNPIIVLIDNEPYIKAFNMGTYIIPARKLTAEEIAEQLADRLEDDRIYKEFGDEAPFWLLEGITREEFMARKAKKKADWEASPRFKQLQDLKAELGREPNVWDIRDMDKKNATEEVRAKMEWEERTGQVKTAFRRHGEWKVRDRYVNAFLSISAVAYTFYYYPASMYFVIFFIAFLYFVGWVIAYRNIIKRARLKTFQYDPKSPYTEAYQRKEWEEDRAFYLEKHPEDAAELGVVLKKKK